MTQNTPSSPPPGPYRPAPYQAPEVHPKLIAAQLLRQGLLDSTIAKRTGLSQAEVRRERVRLVSLDQWLIAARALIDAGATPREAAKAIERPLAHLLVALKEPPSTERIPHINIDDEIRELYRSGLTVTQIANEVNRSRIVVGRVLNHDPKHPKPPHPVLVFSHLSTREASEQLDVPLNTVYYIRRKHGKAMPARVLKIRAMAKSGVSNRQIAAHRNMSLQAVTAIVQNRTHYDPDYTPPPTLRERVLAHPEESPAELAAKLYVSLSYVHSIRRRGCRRATQAQIKDIREMALRGFSYADMCAATGLSLGSVHSIANNKSHHDPDYVPPTPSERKEFRKPHTRNNGEPVQLAPGLRCYLRPPHRVTLLKTAHMPLTFPTLDEARAFAKRAEPHLDTLRRLSKFGGIVSLTDVVDWLCDNPPPPGHQAIAGGHEGVRPDNLLHWPIDRPPPVHRAVQMGTQWVVAGRMFPTLAQALAWPRNQHHDEDWAKLPMKGGFTEQQFCEWCNATWPADGHLSPDLRAHLMPGHMPGPDTIVASVRKPPLAQEAGGYWARYDDPDTIYDSAQELVDRRHSAR